MRIGILSDTHGKTKRLQKALELLTQNDAEAVVHCGDILSAEEVQVLGGFPGLAYLTAGNMDRHAVESIAESAESLGVMFAADFLSVPLRDGRELIATHGHLEELLDDLIRSGQYAYVCHGHTHYRRDERVGPTRVINPGALYHAKDRQGESVCLLDTDKDTVEFLKI
jgi:putative phosphoesterase